MLTTIEHGERGRVLELRLERPPANALSPELIAELGHRVRGAPDEGVEAIVLSGREGLFSAGLDVPCFLTLDREGVKRAWDDFFGLMVALVSSPVPVVAALTGHSPGGGCVLGLCCDHRVFAAGDYRIGLNEVRVGLRMPRPILALARHVVGMRQAERMCTQALLLDGEEALRIGLVDELAPAGDVVSRALAWSEGMLELPPDALRKTRAIARRELLRAFDHLDEEQLELLMDEWFSDETQDAMRALVERLRKK